MAEKDKLTAGKAQVGKKQSMYDKFVDQLKKEIKSVGEKPIGATADVLNRGILANALGSPVDLINLGLKGVEKVTGLPVSTEKPFLGSEYIGDKMRDVGFVSDERRPILETGVGLVPVVPGMVSGLRNIGKTKTMPDKSLNEMLIEYKNNPPARPLSKQDLEQAYRQQVEPKSFPEFLTENPELKQKYLRGLGVETPEAKPLSYQDLQQVYKQQPETKTFNQFLTDNPELRQKYIRGLGVETPSDVQKTEEALRLWGNVEMPNQSFIPRTPEEKLRQLMETYKEYNPTNNDFTNYILNKYGYDYLPPKVTPESKTFVSPYDYDNYINFPGTKE